MLPVSLLLLFIPAIVGQDVACDTANNQLSTGTYRLQNTACTSIQYCHADNRTTMAGPGECKSKGCRVGEYASGYSQYEVLPPRCGTGQFCPDEGDACLDQIAVGEDCQLARDDECAPPPSNLHLANSRNWGGSLCLNFLCTWANATLGSTCILDNRGYIGYLSSGSEFVSIVSRDNCATGLYCDGPTLACQQQKKKGDSCESNKECGTFNCLASNVCGVDLVNARQPHSFTTTLLTTIIIPVSILLISYSLLLLHIKQSKRKFEGDRKFREEIERIRKGGREGYGSLGAGGVAELRREEGGGGWREPFDTGAGQESHKMGPSEKGGFAM